jgi:alpha-galactosidase
MTNEKVREYLKSRVREYYDMGYRFIKNDYNQNTGIGATNTYNGSSCAEGLIRNTDAFYSFINELYAEFPDLVIENCGSGAMRDENKTLRRFALQSTSDQEIYYNNPSIIIGSSILMPPEKAGIWSYPYPTTFLGHATFVPTEEFMAERADGKETAFNTVSTLMGVFYQSGRIDVADEKNLSLVKEGVEIYKRTRKYHAISRPVYPTGLCNINERKVASFGLLSSERLLLAVWNICDTDSDVSLDLAKYVGENATIVTSYAAEDYGTKLSGGILTSTMTPMSATFLEIAF